MPHKLGNGISLFINVRKWAGSLFVSALLHDFTQVKATEVRFTFYKILSLSFKDTNVKKKLALLWQ